MSGSASGPSLIVQSRPPPLMFLGRGEAVRGAGSGAGDGAESGVAAVSGRSVALKQATGLGRRVSSVCSPVRPYFLGGEYSLSWHRYMFFLLFFAKLFGLLLVLRDRSIHHFFLCMSTLLEL